jgi:hypothetical protein
VSATSPASSMLAIAGACAILCALALALVLGRN